MRERPVVSSCYRSLVDRPCKGSKCLCKRPVLIDAERVGKTVVNRVKTISSDELLALVTSTAMLGIDAHIGGLDKGVAIVLRRKEANK